jgi:GMP synthase-like glutamine amidotransferase
MHIHFIQHVPFENPGSIITWATENNYNTSFTKVFEPFEFPSINLPDMLVIMGGPMGVYEEKKYEWLKKEKLFIKRVISANKKVLGICLGSQLVAEVMGAKVFPHKLKEIGWWPVQKINNHLLTINLPATFTTFHWHGDTFELPHGAIQLFKTAGCEQQGFIYNDHVAGLQFHMELKEDLLYGMIEHEKEELVKATYIQSEEEIKEKTPLHISQQQKYMQQFLEAFVKY